MSCSWHPGPLLLGDSGRGLFHLPGLQHMAERCALQVTEMRAIGHDWRITAEPSRLAFKRGAKRHASEQY